MTADVTARIERLTRGVLAFGGLTAALVLSVARPAVAQTSSQVVPAGSLVIAMDNTKQNIGSLFNLKAYGLAVKLLHSEIPLKWVIRAGKAKDAVDFTATASRIAPTAIAATALSFSGGPIIIHRAYAARAKPIITSFGGNVAVYELTQDVVMDVRHELQFKPKPWVNNTNASIATKTLIEAGISDYIVGDQSTISPTSCYTIIVEPHNTSTTAAPAIRSFLEAGGNFYAQCASVVAFENHSSGRYMTTAGFTLSNTNASLTYPYPAEPFSQFIGDLDPAPGGSEQDFRLATGSTFNSYSSIHAQSIGVTPLTFSQGRGGVGLSIGGRVFYSGGHDHSGTDLPNINLRRMFLNAVLTPALRPAACNFVVATPDLTAQKAIGGTLQEEYNGVYTISVTNSGSAATAEAITVVDTLPAGVAHVATSGAGWTFTVAAQVVTARYAGTLNAGGGASFTITVKFGSAAIGTVTNRAHISGGGEINTANNVATNVATIAGRPNISLLKSVKDATAAPGALLQYTLLFKNQGTAPAVNVVLVDPLPAQVQFAVNSVETTLPAGVNVVVEYSRDSAVSWSYTPLTAGCGAPAGFDGCVTHLRWRLLNPLDAAEGSNFGTLRFSTRVK